MSFRDFENLNDSIILMFNNDDKRNDTIIEEKSFPPYVKNIEKKFNMYNKENESMISEDNKNINNNDDIFNNFGFNQIKI